MKEIQLTKGYVAMVDDEDFGWLSKYRWYAHQKNNQGVVYARSSIEGKRVLMHRAILGVSDKRVEVDHKNNNGLDNQRHNIRVCSHAENQRNSGVNKNSKSGYKGVSWSRTQGKWIARIMVDKKEIRLGAFDCIDSAARKYNEASKLLHGEFARINSVSDGPIITPSVVGKSNTSGFRGVSFYKRKNRYFAAIEHNGRVIRAGSSTSAVEAAKMYDKKAIELLGEKARTNFKY